LSKIAGNSQLRYSISASEGDDEAALIIISLLQKSSYSKLINGLGQAAIPLILKNIVPWLGKKVSYKESYSQNTQYIPK